MSFRAFVWAWDQPLEKDDHLIVLLALAEIYHDETGQLFASLPYIAARCRKDVRTVRRALLSMEDTGVVCIEKRDGRTDIIRLNIPTEFVVRMPEKMDLEHGKRGRPKKNSDTEEGGFSGKTHGAKGENPPHQKAKPPSPVSYEQVEPKINQKRDSSADEFDDFGDRIVKTLPVLVAKARTPDQLAEATFETWWALYPRRVSKGSARDAYAKAIGKIGVQTAERVLVAGVTQLAADLAGEPAKWIPHAATWLNQEGWNDEPGARSRNDGAGPGGGGSGPPAGGGRAPAKDRLGNMLAGAMEALNRHNGND